MTILECLDLIQDHDTPDDYRLELAQALYYLLNDFHDGEASKEARLLEKLQYTPGPLTLGLDSPTSRKVYRELTWR